MDKSIQDVWPMYGARAKCRETRCDGDHIMRGVYSIAHAPGVEADMRGRPVRSELEMDVARGASGSPPDITPNWASGYGNVKYGHPESQTIERDPSGK